MNGGFQPGDRVYIARGSYKGSYGKVLKVMRCKASILVDSDKAIHDLWKTSLHLQSPVRPTTSVAAILHQYPDLDEQLEDVCYHLARCSIDSSSTELYEIISSKIRKHDDDLKPCERIQLPNWIRKIKRRSFSHYVSD